MLRNLERLDTRYADDSANERFAINSVKGLLTVILSPDDDALMTQRDRLGKYFKISFTLLIRYSLTKQSEEIPNHQDKNSLHEKVFEPLPH